MKTQDDRIRIEYMPLSSLVKWHRNPKDHDIGQLHSSYNRFGQVAPLIIDEGSGMLVAGHGRLDTLVQKFESGEAPPPRIIAKGKDWHVPVVRGVRFESDQEAEAYLLADNRICELGGWDPKGLTDVLQEFAREGDQMMEGIGFDADDLNALLAGNPPNKDSLSREPSEITCPSCGHRFVR